MVHYVSDQLDGLAEFVVSDTAFTRHARFMLSDNGSFALVCFPGRQRIVLDRIRVQRIHTLRDMRTGQIECAVLYLTFVLCPNVATGTLA